MAVNRYLLDSDILIEQLRGRPQAKSFIADLRLVGEMMVSTITIAELFTGVRNKQDAGAINDLLRLTRIVPVDESIAQRGGIIRGQYRQSHGTSLSDAIIAATAEMNQAILVSFNKRHFPMITNLLVPYERV